MSYFIKNDTNLFIIILKKIFICHLQIYWSQETPELPSAGSQQMLTTVFQSMPPKLDVSFPHNQAEESQSISLEVLESDPLHDFLQAVHIEGSRTK